jgi:hypothetical protein
MLGFVLIAAIVVGIVWYVLRDMNVSVKDKLSSTAKKAEASIHSAADVNNDGKVNASDAKTALDVNKDGKVNLKDVKEVAVKTKRVAKNTAKKINATKKKK